MGFVEITQDEINQVPEPVKLPKHVVDFALLVKANKFDFRNDSKLNYMVEKAFIEGLETETTPRQEAVVIRKNAYCLVFGISPVELKNTWVTDFDLLRDKSRKRAEVHESEQKCPCTADARCKHMCETINQIRKDLNRTSVIFEEDGQESPCEIEFMSGKNPLYNILTAYAEFDQQIGYTQGMNFLVALLYSAVEDEVVAFGLMCKIMFELNWRDVYKDELLMLIQMTRKIQAWLKKDQCKISQHLDEAGVILEAQLSSPIMGLFANLVPLGTSLRLLDRFIMYGEKGVLSIVKKAFLEQKKTILGIEDPFELQIYLTRQIYLDSLTDNKLLNVSKRTETKCF